MLAGSTLALTALLLGACSDDGESSSTTTDQATTTTIVNTSSLADVEISTDVAVAPTVTFDPSFALADTTTVDTEVVVPGEGATVEDGQRLSLDYVVISGIDGAELESTWGQGPETVPLDATLQEGIKSALVGQQVGARIAAASYAQGQWVIFVFDIRDTVTVPTSASGTDVAPVEGLPTVALVEGVPTVTLPGTPPPAELVVQPLIVGNGPAVESGQTVTVQYVGVKWSDGSIFDSSWDRGAPADFAVGTGNVIAGFEEGLIGQPVGSRVMLIIPPDKGYGEQGNPQAGISGTETLVFVIDILAAS